MHDYDAIIIGGGHNGLVCGAYLAKVGLRTLVLERQTVIGGAALSDEVVPGFRFSVFSYGLQHLHPKIIHDLELKNFGLNAVPWENLFCPMPDGSFIATSESVQSTQNHFARFSRRDAERYPQFLAFHENLAKHIRPLTEATPINPSKSSAGHLFRNLHFAWKNRALVKDIFEIIELFTLSAEEYLAHWFESDAIRALYAYQAGIGNFLGPRSRGSALACLYNMLSDHSAEVPRGHVIGGMGFVSQAIAASGRRFGLDIHTNAEVAEVLVRDGKVKGVVTRDGREFSAPIVASNAHSKVLFSKLVNSKELPDELLAGLGKFNTEGTNWKINIAAERPPAFKAFTAASGIKHPWFVHIGPSIDYLERAYDDAKYGRFAARPWMSVCTPTYRDETMAPPGKHVVHIYGGHVPYKLKEADWTANRSEFVQSVYRVLEEYAPGFTEGIIGTQVLLPQDIEEKLNIPGGNILHGQMTPDQLFSRRPYPRYADYRTPIRGLYQCGASCHPGGGVTGLPGHNAAREILRDRSRRIVV